jgi:hypothetical protein
MRNAKVQKKPNAFMRANCGIRATKQGALRKCAGKCTPEWKPSYFRTECQRAVCCAPIIRLLF